MAGQAMRQADYTTLTRQDIEALIQRFGPIIRHHPNELFLMDDPETILDLHPPLRWGLVNTDYDTYSEAILGETLTTAATTKQDEANARTHPQASDRLFRTWLHLNDDLTTGNMARAKAIVHARKTSTGFLDLQFWLFYPFNGPGRFRVTVGDVINEDVYLAEPGRHYGDWEYVTVRLAYDVLNPSDPWRPLALFMSQHASGQWINANDSRLEYQATHPILYSAYFSHAIYPTAGRHYYLRPFSVDIIVGTIAVDLFDLTGNGATIDTSQPNKYAWVASNLPHLGISPPTWLDYTGRWGQTEKLDATIVIDIPVYGDYRLPVFEEIGTGPSGPAQKGAWKNGDQ